MSEMKMWEILVPTNRNDGRPISTRFHRIWDEKVRKLTNGLTILKPAIGQWVEPEQKKLYKERMIPVRIMCPDETIDEIMDMTAKYYEQKAVLVFAISTECKLKNYNVDDDKPSCPTSKQLQKIRSSCA